MPWFPEMSSLGEPVPREMLGLLRESSGALADPEALRGHLARDGYLFLRGVLDREAVLAARTEVFSRLAAVGEIGDPPVEGLATGISRRETLEPDLGAFWKSICEGPLLRRVTHAGNMITLMHSLLGGEVRPFDFLWLRAMPPGRASAFHYDHVYMNRGTEQLFTVWTPLGEVPMQDGPILVMEDSHRWEDVIAAFRGLDVDRDKSRPGHVTMTPVSFAAERGCRLLTADFEAGDLLVMSMFLLHGSLDNHSPLNRVRLSCDTRYQRADEPVDERWVGEHPPGHGGGYAGVGGARPLTAAPLRR